MMNLTDMLNMKQVRLRVIMEGYYKNGQIVYVHPYDSNTIKIYVAEDIKYGNYRVGIIVDGSFNVCYIGRATDQPLQDRMLQHTEYMDGNYYFDFDAADTETEAMDRECIDYHSFGENERMDNDIHPSLSKGRKCPWAGCDHLGE